MLRAIITTIALSTPAVASAQVPDLLAALDIDGVMGAMAAEGRDDGQLLREALLPQTPPGRWQSVLTDIYDTARMEDAFRTTFTMEIEGAGGASAPMLHFFTSDLGEKIVAVELEARHALLEDAAKDEARLQVEEMRASDDPRLGRLEEFAAANDLVEMNVSGALNASFAFSQGLQAAGGYEADVTEQDLLRDAWAQEPLIRSETEAWLYPYLVTAYTGLTDEELARYVEFSRSRDGRILNAALFAGFDDMFRALSRDLGRATGREINGRDI